MTREELLKSLDISGSDLDDFLLKYDAFHNSLNSAQRALLMRSVPTVDTARRFFGPDVTADELTDLLDANRRHRVPTFCCFPLGKVRSS